jgi:hypothetical protein
MCIHSVYRTEYPQQNLSKIHEIGTVTLAKYAFIRTMVISFTEEILVRFIRQEQSLLQNMHEGKTRYSRLKRRIESDVSEPKDHTLYSGRHKNLNSI